MCAPSTIAPNPGFASATAEHARLACGIAHAPEIQTPIVPMRGYERRRDLAPLSMNAWVKSGGKRTSNGDQVRTLRTLIADFAATVATCIPDAEPTTRPFRFRGRRSGSWVDAIVCSARRCGIL